MTVGDPAPGRMEVMRSSAARGALSITYLAPWEATTPLIRSTMLSSSACSSGSGGCGLRISTAWLPNTVSRATRPLASNVAPVETRSQMAWASFSRGATSTAPRMVTISAFTPWLSSQRRRILG